jgi:hypothetical protein
MGFAFYLKFGMYYHHVRASFGECYLLAEQFILALEPEELESLLQSYFLLW